MIESNDKSINIDNVISTLQLKNKDTDAFLKNAKAKKLDDAISFFRELTGNTTKLSAGIINFASRFTSNPNALEEESKPIFLKLLKKNENLA